ncbi:MAG: TIGR02647 family protein [Gammaproteobacteria bacterium]|uniref:TIGR02647 family protein n=1 Tax=Candidatus Thiopontia autotrophica TaxID=2841688 RepID=A0A8J6TXN6_9GAMM|nr:TIGR02647 family protein [Candidatus Thiopontia autotrophica]MBL6969596.1 TIGR02647 family protein [Gammaproteobacteria bacterium]
MSYTQELVDELNLLMQFDLHSTQEGIKIHNSAGVGMVKAAERLHKKGITSQKDGGYLTDFGIECAERAQTLHDMLS